MTDRPLRRALIQTRVTADERLAIEAAAERTGRSVSEWVRDVLRSAAGMDVPGSAGGRPGRRVDR